MAELLAKTDARSPLYLKAACEELRNFAVYEKMSSFLRDTLPPTVPLLFAALLERLDGDHGRELVALALSFIAVSRAGMLELEMVDILADWRWADEPRSNFSRLYTGIKMFVASGGSGLMQLFHGTLLAAVSSRYMPTAADATRVHRALADYFRRLADPSGAGRWDGRNRTRGLQELCFHLMRCGAWAELEAVLGDLTYACCGAAHAQVHRGAVRVGHGLRACGRLHRRRGAGPGRRPDAALRSLPGVLPLQGADAV